MLAVGVIFSIFGVIGGVTTFLIRQSDWYAAELEKKVSDMAEIPDAFFWASLVMLIIGLLLIAVSLARSVSAPARRPLQSYPLQPNSPARSPELADTAVWSREAQPAGAGYEAAPGDDTYVGTPAAYSGWYCRACGGGNRPEDLFCVRCGNRKPSAAAYESGDWICPWCNRVQPDSASVCPYCGYERFV